MKGRTNGAGGGASLNFSVKAYASEEVLLAEAPAENTTGIITATPISSWAISPTQPSEPVEGMVWITTGKSSAVAFNALKKNAIQIFPNSAKQYSSGAWIDVPAKSYQNGGWVDWFSGVYLFNDGDQCEDLTGGWQSVTTLSQNYATPDGQTIIGDRLIVKTVNGDGTGNRQSALATAKAVDVSEYSTLKVVVDEVTASEAGFDSSKYCCFGLSSNQAEHTAATAVTKAGELSMDISAMSGSFYPFIQISNESRTMAVSRIWLE